MSDGVLLVLAGVLVVLAGLLACVEAALARVSRVPNGSALAQIAADPPRYLNLLLLLRLAAELGATAIVAVVTGSILLAAVVMTVVSYVGVGVGPRTVGVQHAEQVASASAGLVVGLARVFGPLPRLLILLGNAITPGRGLPGGPFANEAELRDLVDLAEERQVIEEGERDMIHSVFELGDTIVREVMVPRPDIVFIERGKAARQALSLALRSGFSRIPVVGDGTDDVVGIAYLKDLVRRDQDLRVDEVMRGPAFVPDSKPVDELLREMQREQTHMAIVVDEYGGTAGLVTIEDILEEIVGEIADEYDREQPAVETVDDRTVRVTARLPVDEVNEMYGVSLPTEDVETVGGLMASALGRVPIPGASVTLEGLTFTAESPKGRRNRIGTVLIHRGGS